MVAALIEHILSRRSIRDGFEIRPVPENVINDVLRCGLAAPSSKDTQPWRLHVVTDERLRAELAEAVETAKDPERYVPSDSRTGEPRPDWPSSVIESATALRDAPLAVFVENVAPFSHGRATVAAADAEHREDAMVGYGLEAIGLGAAVQSMWLAATSHGLRGVFMGDVLIAESAIRSRLGMGGDLAGVLALGYSTGEPRRERRLAPDWVVRHTGW